MNDKEGGTLKRSRTEENERTAVEQNIPTDVVMCLSENDVDYYVGCYS